MEREYNKDSEMLSFSFMMMQTILISSLQVRRISDEYPLYTSFLFVAYLVMLICTLLLSGINARRTTGEESPYWGRSAQSFPRAGWMNRGMRWIRDC